LAAVFDFDAHGLPSLVRERGHLLPILRTANPSTISEPPGPILRQLNRLQLDDAPPG
jgi:hypothetical protein